MMKNQYLFLLVALLCQSALAAFQEKQSATLSGVTYKIGNDGDDCGVTRTEGGTTLSYLYTSGASANSCVGQNLFVIDSNVWVIFSIGNTQDILTSSNSATGSTSAYKKYTMTANFIVIGKIDSTSSGSFGKFSWAIMDVGANTAITQPSDITYVSAVSCTADSTIQLTVNIPTGSQMGVLDYPINAVLVTGDGSIQVFGTTGPTLKAYAAGSAPACTNTPTGGTGGTGTTAEKQDSGIAPWKLAVIIAVPFVVLFSGGIIFCHVKSVSKGKSEAAKRAKFEELPVLSEATSPHQVITQV